MRRSKWLSSVRGRSLGLGVALTVLSVAGGMLALAGDEQPGLGGAGGAGAPVFRPGVDKAMTAAQARADRPEGLQGCYNAFPDDAVRPNCVFGHPGGSRRIALVGDSHAAQWFPGVQALASSRGWTMYFWAKASCPLVGADIWLSAYKAPFSECSRWRRSVLAQLHAMPRLDTVVVVRGRNYDDGVAAPDGHRVSREELEFQWRESFAAGLKGLTAVSPKVVLLRPSPWPGTDVPRCRRSTPRRRTFATSRDSEPKPWGGRWTLRRQLYSPARRPPRSSISPHRSARGTRAPWWPPTAPSSTGTTSTSPPRSAAPLRDPSERRSSQSSSGPALGRRRRLTSDVTAPVVAGPTVRFAADLLRSPESRYRR